MTKTRLHAELDALVPSGTKARSQVRMVGHALIELGLLTSMECAWLHCVMPTREFEPYLSGDGRSGPRAHGIPTIGHVVSLSDGGTDMPLNLQLLHFRCNSAKGAQDWQASDAGKATASQSSKLRWQDDEYRERVAAAIAAKRSPEQAAGQSAKMKAHWADPEKRAAHIAAIKRGRWGT